VSNLVSGWGVLEGGQARAGYRIRGLAEGREQQMWRNIMGAWAVVACAVLLAGTGAAAQAATGPHGAARGGSPAGAAGVAGARAVSAGGGWGKPVEVARALNTGGNALIRSVSCASAGNCSAGGFYSGSGGAQAFVVSETDGTWGTAVEVAGVLNTGGNAQIQSVSCASAGNCSAGGFYTAGSSGDLQAFVVNEVNGTWGTGTQVAGALNTGGNAVIFTVSCASAGNCSAGGYYTSAVDGQLALIINETDGTWGTARQVAAHLRGSQIQSVSCASAGNCTAGGDSGLFGQAFVINETDGTWGRAAEIAGTHSTGEYAQIFSVSCASAGNCSAGGAYDEDSSSGGPDHLFVVSQTRGIWGKARQLLAGRNTGQFATVRWVSCASAGNCTASGGYTSSTQRNLSFVISQANGTWGKPETFSGTVSIDQVSCASAGNCSAGGTFGTATASQALVINETDGAWGKPVEVAVARNTRKQAAIYSVSCTPAGYCTAGGSYLGKAGQEVFAVSKPRS
jgi:hypothetical protein